ncbi:acyltransferase [Ligilactobacillus salivarius]|uniref:acyltransferase n=1 Tax=Ligilactobacillus salivarius TaxID=1624 RepID=UPI0022E98ECB|nr:acyltransferase [Ligilactobacillus salivarius]
MIRKIKCFFKKAFSNTFYYAVRYRMFGSNLFVGVRSRVTGKGFMKLGKNVTVHSDCFIATFPQNKGLIIGNNVMIGQFSRIGCKNSVIIEDNVFTGPNVFIADYNHNYSNINIPILEQDDVVYTKGVVIKRDTWIGTNVSIIGNVNIGKHCVIGANSVVTHSIPDYSVAVGCPARVIKRYDFNQNKWVKVR